MPTLRQQIFTLLTDSPWNSRQLADRLGLLETEVVDHLPHIAKSATAQSMKLEIQPAECRKCGFVFRSRKRLNRPGRCPECRGERIDAPVYSLLPIR